MSARCRIVGLLAAALLFTSAGRAEQDVEVSVEVKFAELSENMFQDLQQRGILGTEDKKTKARNNVVFLNDAQVLRFIQSVQNDPNTNVMQVPKMTMLNGQSAKFKATDERMFVTGFKIIHRKGKVEYQPKTEVIPLGVQLALQPIVSADRRFVRLHLDAKMNDFVSPQVFLPGVTRFRLCKEGCPDAEPVPGVVTQYIHGGMNKLSVDRTLMIPDKSTALLMGWKKQCEVTKSVGPEILSEIPYLGQLFRTVECEPHHLLVLVTPRILVNLEEEAKKPRAFPPLNEP
jgi:general secretion pathway protein D